MANLIPLAGMKLARAKDKLCAKKPKRSDKQQRELRKMYDTGDFSASDLAELSRSHARPSTELWSV